MTVMVRMLSKIVSNSGSRDANVFRQGFEALLPYL